MSDPILRLSPYAESCVFSKQSPVPGFCDHMELRMFSFTPVAPLLPKLRGQLAEFLNDSYPAHLSLLSQSTCVGFGYGRYFSSLEAFLGSRASVASSLTELPIRSQHMESRFFLGYLPTPLNRDFHRPAPPSFLRHPFGPYVEVSGQECLPAVH